MSYLLVIINNFNICSTGFGPSKTEPKLLVDPDTVLPFASMRQGFEHVAGWDPQIIQASRGLQLANLAQCDALEVDEAPDSIPASKLFRIFAFERADRGQR